MSSYVTRSYGVRVAATDCHPVGLDSLADQVHRRRIDRDTQHTLTPGDAQRTVRPGHRQVISPVGRRSQPSAFVGSLAPG